MMLTTGGYIWVMTLFPAYVYEHIEYMSISSSFDEVNEEVVGFACGLKNYLQERLYCVLGMNQEQSIARHPALAINHKDADFTRSYSTLTGKNVVVGKQVASNESGSLHYGIIKDTLDYNKVAIQNMRESENTEARLQQEIELLKKCKHSNVVQYIDRSSGGRFPAFIVLEYLHCSLTKVITISSQKHLLDESIKLKMVCELINAIGFIHSQKIIHSNISSHNIFVNEKNNIKLGGFGCAIDVEKSKYSLQVDIPTDARFAAPEIYLYEKEAVDSPNLDHIFAVDVYSFGVILWQLLTLRIPFEDKADRHVARLKKSKEESKRHEQIPSAHTNSPVGNLITMCWQQAPLRPSAEQLKHILSEEAKALHPPQGSSFNAYRKKKPGFFYNHSN